jgi:hypothetical protein
MPFNVPKYIKITDYDGNPTAFLSPEDGLKDAKVDMRQNKESTLEFYLPPSCEKLQEITPECRIYPGNNKEYMIFKDEAFDLVRREDGKLWAKVMPEESFIELNYSYSSVRNDGEDPGPQTVVIVSGGNNLSGGLYQVGTAAHALHGLLANVDWGGKTPWTVGVVDVPGIHDLETDRMNVLDNIKKIQELWGGILDWDSVNHTVSLRNDATWQNYNGFGIYYGKNLKEITKTQSNRIITRLYVYGMDNLNIAEVNDGKEYLEDYSYTLRTYSAIVQNPDISDQEQLKQWGLRQLKYLSKPRFSYSVKAVDLRTLPEHSHETFALNDMVDVFDPDITEPQRLRIVRHAYFVFQPWKCEIEIGDPVLNLVDILAAGSSASDFISSRVSSTGKLSDVMTVRGLQILIDSGVSISWGSIRNPPSIPTTPEELGALSQNWVGTTYIDENGVYTGEILANQIVAGTLDASKITVSGLVVGENVTLGPNVSISWSKVTDKPFIPSTASDVGAVPNDQTSVFNALTNNGTLSGLFMSDGNLYINASYITTGTLNTERLGGTVINFDGGPSIDVSDGRLRLRRDSSNYISIGNGIIDFYFPSVPAENRPNVQSDGFYIGNKKVGETATAVFK